MTPPPNHDTMHRFDRHLARIAVGGYDDAQAIRTATYNRVRDVIRKRREDIPFDAVEDEKDDADYGSEYDDDNLPALLDELQADGTLTAREHQYVRAMLDAATTAEQLEHHFQSIFAITEQEPIFKTWLTNVYGVSTTLTAKLIHQFGYCEDFDRVSHLWSYCGMAPGQQRTRGETLGYNPEAKTLAWLVADRIIMQGDRSLYKREFYDPYKRKQVRRMERAEDMTDAELESVEWTPPESQGHAHNRAVRYLAKKFLKHYWAIARDIEGLAVPDEWVITHGGHEKRTDTFENPFHAREVVRTTG